MTRDKVLRRILFDIGLMLDELARLDDPTVMKGYVREIDAAKRLGITERTLRNYRKEARLSHKKLGRIVYYPESVIDQISKAKFKEG